MHRGRRLLGFAALTAISLPTRAQTSRVETTTELEDFLYILNPHAKGHPDAIQVLWIPPPIQSLCLGKAHDQCSSIDYCIRTTNQNVSMCRNLGMDLAKLPAYPSGMRPKRLLSITFWAGSLIKGWPILQAFCANQPPGQLDRLSKSQRIKARIKLTRSTDDDQFELLEVLAVSPL
jgi:hypothetical protein